MLGSDALMRLSLEMSFPSFANGTLKSTRMNTRLPFKSKSRIDKAICLIYRKSQILPIPGKRITRNAFRAILHGRRAGMVLGGERHDPSDGSGRRRPVPRSRRGRAGAAGRVDPRRYGLRSAGNRK